MRRLLRIHTYYTSDKKGILTCKKINIFYTIIDATFQLNLQIIIDYLYRFPIEYEGMVEFKSKNQKKPGMFIECD